ncbi:PREDICTED: serine carboxypeptidase-like 33 isoform X2 [Nicotiana attenuata]|uniref:serine carboxypeptidase-like 33 isoform X2 n=1 Tax=Nicotiana attenuata TaxID=49451 RepID=UPI000905A0EF|nr:PREDICTED: serine carboxypeptidase-like 33 isoform X2 [Nicotiana attenuata]
METSIPKNFRYIVLIFLFLICWNKVFARTQEDDNVTKLPGQPTTPQVSQFSGYITVNKTNGRALFYWFFPSQSESSKKPLLLWLNGGPGCSSVGYGAAVELGPLLVENNGAGLDFNSYSWNKEANLLFLESPVGVGFSYTNTSSDLTSLDDDFAAEDAYNFLVNWLERFPEFKNREFFISGESYAGHYVPQLAELVYNRNKDSKKYPYINLKGLIVGNPETNDYYDYKGILEYAWSHAVIYDSQYEKAKQVCDFNLSNWSDACNDAMKVVWDKYEEIDIYNIYAPKCLRNTSSSSSASLAVSGHESSKLKALNYGFRRMKRIPGGYDPCYTVFTEEYFNRLDVQIALHANIEGRHTRVKWQSCSDPVFQKYNYNVLSVLPIYKKLIQGGLKIWIFSGDADGRVPVIGTRYCIEALNLTLKSEWHSWFHNHQVAGRIVEYEGLTFVTVRGAGHLVPLYKPSEALALIHSFLTGEQLPAHR